MVSLVSRAFRRRVKRHLKAGSQDRKTDRLYRAACRLLATHDHEQISVANFAQAAEISVGAFYGRFTDKEAFLSRVVALRLSGSRQGMQEALDPARWQHRATAAVTRAIVEEMLRNLHGHGAGVIRAALKRGYLDRAQLEPLQAYRTALGDRAVTLLAHRVEGVKQPEPAIRAAMQMAEATALDALLHERGPLRPGSRHMAATLSAMLHSMAGLAATPPALPDDSDADDDDDVDGMLDMPIEEVIAMSDPESPPPATRRRRTRPSRHMRAESAAKETPYNQRVTIETRSYHVDLLHESAFEWLIGMTWPFDGTMRPLAAFSRGNEITPRMLMWA